MPVELPTLYKFTKSGAVQQWTVTAYDDHYICRYGRKDGKITEAKRTVKQKNVGKANETSLPQQALLEAQAKWKKQLDKGYSEDLPKQMSITKPMLAHSKVWAPEDNRVTFPLWLQPKLDGFRCIATKRDGEVTLQSRQGKLIHTLPLLTHQLAKVMKDSEVWDGELYNHTLSFQDIAKLVKKHREDSNKIQYHVYDTVDDKPFYERIRRIPRNIRDLTAEFVQRVGMHEVHCDEDILRMQDTLIGNGYEGCILRVGDCTYRNGYRSRELIKVKTFYEGEFLIIGAEENEGRQEGQCCFICKTDQGYEFKVKPVGTDEERRHYWEEREKFIGQYLTVTYFGLTTTETPVPRFPIGKAIRPAWDR